MPEDQELKRIIASGIAKGYSDDDIRLVIQEHKRRQPSVSGSITAPLSWAEAKRQYDAGTFEAAQLDVNAQTQAGRMIVDAVKAGPEQIGYGVRDIARGDIAKGSRRVLAGGLQTAAVIGGPGAVRAFVAAPLATTAALAGGAATAAVTGPVAEHGARAFGATDDQAGLVGDVASLAGGAVGGALASKATTAIGRAMTEVLPERLYAQIFKTAEDDLRRAYMAQANGRTPDPSLARKAIEEGIVGSPEKMAVYSLEKLGELESSLQAKAGREILIMPDKQKYIAMLEGLAEQFKGGFFSTRADDARALVTALQSKPGPLAKATDMLAVKRFLDGLRNTSSFKLDPSLTQKQEELKIAADLVRATLHKRSALSALIDREKTFIRAVDAIADHAVKRGNREVFGLIDAVLTQAGPSGATAALVRHGAMAPSVMTRLAQGLTKTGRAVGAATPLPPARAAGAGVVGSVVVR